jgi:hypothetical protein
MIPELELLLARASARLVPAIYEKRLRQWALRSGLQAPTFVLSFDCDTARDADAALRVQEYLHAHGMNAVYAVPGELLEAHWSDYQKLLGLGAKFINHGYRCHAAVSPETGKPYSTFTYRDVEPEVWQKDILLGHNLLTRLTGVPPRVFRTPHFGEFNRPDDLQKMYSFIASMGYRVSTSTKPVFGMVHGGVYDTGAQIIEVPLNGCLGKPAQLIDSWGFISAPDALGKKLLVDELHKYARLFEAGVPLLLNIYFDPADIVNEEDVLHALSFFSQSHCISVDSDDLLALSETIK